LVCGAGGGSVFTFAWYSTTDDFNRRVGSAVVNTHQDATGEESSWKVRFDLRHLAVG
jgi:hypothetical protein